MRSANLDHGRGGIHASDGMTKPDQISGHRLGGAAAEIEDRARRRQQRPETVKPGLFKKLGTCATLDPVQCLALIQIDDPFGFFRPHLRTHAPRIAST
jgi:hypothetical protein